MFRTLGTDSCMIFSAGSRQYVETHPTEARTEVGALTIVGSYAGVEESQIGGVAWRGDVKSLDLLEMMPNRTKELLCGNAENENEVYQMNSCKDGVLFLSGNDVVVSILTGFTNLCGARLTRTGAKVVPASKMGEFTEVRDRQVAASCATVD